MLVDLTHSRKDQVVPYRTSFSISISENTKAGTTEQAMDINSVTEKVEFYTKHGETPPFPTMPVPLSPNPQHTLTP